MFRPHSGPGGIPSLHCPDLLQSLVKVELNPSHDGLNVGQGKVQSTQVRVDAHLATVASSTDITYAAILAL